MNPSVYILSQPVQTGKTSALMQWIRTQESAAGILTPDVNGKRMLYDIASGSYSEFESDEKEALEIGKFRFSKTAFAKAQQLLLQAATRSPAWLIVDEVGKLELMKNSGLEPAISQLTAMYSQGKNNSRLLLVIRESLLKDAISHYQLGHAVIVHASFFSKPLTGLVMCGGKSTRMGTDKALMNYHGEPQFIYMYRMLKTFMGGVFISCNKDQVEMMNAGYPFIPDSEKYSNAGPMTGLLSAFHQFPDQPFMVMGCDYPMIDDDIIVALMKARDDQYDAVCYHDDTTGFDEPLVAIYESSCHPLLETFYKNGQTSLQQFLKAINTRRIQATDSMKTKSIDTMPASEGLNKFLQDRGGKTL